MEVLFTDRLCIQSGVGELFVLLVCHSHEYIMLVSSV